MTETRDLTATALSSHVNSGGREHGLPGFPYDLFALEDPTRRIKLLDVAPRLIWVLKPHEGSGSRRGSSAKKIVLVLLDVFQSYIVC